MTFVFLRTELNHVFLLTFCWCTGNKRLLYLQICPWSRSWAPRYENGHKYGTSFMWYVNPPVSPLFEFTSPSVSARHRASHDVFVQQRQISSVVFCKPWYPFNHCSSAYQSNKTTLFRSVQQMAYSLIEYHSQIVSGTLPNDDLVLLKKKATARIDYGNRCGLASCTSSCRLSKLEGPECLNLWFTDAMKHTC